LRTVTNLTGYGLVAMSHPKGFLAGVQQLALAQSRAKRWKALAKKYRSELLKLRASKSKPKSLRRRA
jgi:hypothetical protein